MSSPRPAHDPSRPARARPALRVAEVVALARDRLEAGFSDLWVEGEISNLKHAPSGHLYFSIKDATAQLRVVLFRSRAVLLRFRLEDGLAVLVRGSLTVYEPRGDLQLAALAVEPTGLGALTLAFEQLRARLEAEGLFAAARKRALPLLPRRIGIVTSSSGAALHDILQVLDRRHAGIAVLLAPARVQGEGAAREIARAIALLGRSGRTDVIIVGRGGGSLEDLAAFNDEGVARAIASCPVPVISAVGHEVDVTIADFVADMRAPTPSAAAELCAVSKLEAEGRVAALRARLASAALSAVRARRLRLADLRGARSLGAVERLPARLGQRLDELRARLEAALRRHLERLRARLRGRERELALLDVRRRLEVDRSRLAATARLLGERGRSLVAARRAALGERAGRLGGLSPLAVLGRGYALATGPGGGILRAASEVRTGEAVAVRLARGLLTCRVEDVREEGA